MRWSAVLCILTACGLLLAQQVRKQKPPHKEQPLTLKKEVKIRVVLKDTTRIVGVVEAGKFVVETAYGVLEVPPSEMRRVVVGKKADKELVERLAVLVRELGSDDFARRRKAKKELKELGAVAITDLKRALQSNDAETRKTATELLAELEKQFSPDEVVPDEDIIETARFTIVGNLRFETFTLKTRYGILRMPKKDITRIEFLVGEESVRVVELRGNFAGTTMVDTGIELPVGAEVEVTATGKMTSHQGISFGPAGLSSDIMPVSWMRGPLRGEPFGALLGRIGRGGRIFKIGARHKFKAKTSGRLFLSFNAKPQFGPYRGSFKVKIRVKK
ncbi:MAG: hypothetical protein DRP63_01215 [Planctomycetota bacterium]|nr:MAG: hypothetical protein DRP63_01215 [Planctomycetota bacterium]